MTIEISPELHQRISAFKPVLEAVMGEPLELDVAVHVLLDVAMRETLKQLLGNVEPGVMLESFLQLATRHREAVYSFVAETLCAGTAVKEQQLAAMREEIEQRRIGFH